MGTELGPEPEPGPEAGQRVRPREQSIPTQAVEGVMVDRWASESGEKTPTAGDMETDGAGLVATVALEAAAWEEGWARCWETAQPTQTVGTQTEATVVVVASAGGEGGAYWETAQPAPMGGAQMEATVAAVKAVQLGTMAGCS